MERMFEALTDRFNGVFNRIRGRGKITEANVAEAMREVRTALLEADVHVQVVRKFCNDVQEKAIGANVIETLHPDQMLVKIVHDELVVLLGEKQVPLAFASVPPTVILLVGLQGSGKTTTAAKLAARLKREQKAPYLVAADVYRPAAEEQLCICSPGSLA